MQKSGILNSEKIPKKNVGLASTLMMIFSLNAYAADVTALHTGSYQVLYNQASSSGKETLQTWYNNMTSTSSVPTISLCDSGSNNSILLYDSTYSYCVLSRWYDVSGQTGIGGFCFKDRDTCRTMSGAGYTTGLLNTNSNTQANKGFYFDSNASTYLNSTAQANYRREFTIANTAFFNCLRTCPNETGWQTNTSTSLNSYPLEINRRGYTCSSTGVCTASQAQANMQCRCPEFYYNAKNSSASSSGQGCTSTYMQCTACPTPPTKRDGTKCAMVAPEAGRGSSLSTCKLAAGCETYDETGDYLFAGQCDATDTGTSGGTTGGGVTTPDTSYSGITTTVKDVIEQVTNIEMSGQPLDVELYGNGLGIDSTQMMNIIVELEELYDISFETGVAAEFVELRDLIDYVQSLAA